MPVADSRPGVALKVSKTSAVGVSVDAQGDVRFNLAARRPKRWRSPSPEAILKARKASGLTQKAAAEKCLSALRSWQDWEYGKRRMHPAIWRVFQSVTASEQAAAAEPCRHEAFAIHCALDPTVSGPPRRPDITTGLPAARSFLFSPPGFPRDSQVSKQQALRGYDMRDDGRAVALLKMPYYGPIEKKEAESRGRRRSR